MLWAAKINIYPVAKIHKTPKIERPHNAILAADSVYFLNNITHNIIVEKSILKKIVATAAPIKRIIISFIISLFTNPV